MRVLATLLLAGCAGQAVIPSIHGEESEDPYYDGPTDPPPIDLRAPEHVELATFALG